MPADPEEATMTHTRTPRRVAGAGTLAMLALAWLLATLSSARYTLGDSPDASPLSVTRAALELPQVIAASVVAGTAVGLVAVNLLTRKDRRLGGRAQLAVSGAAGAVTGLAVATPIALGYDRLPNILVLAAAVAVAATLGGLLAGVSPRAVIAAGIAGALGVFVVRFLTGLFDGNLRSLFGAGDSPESILAASGWVVFASSLVAGVVAGVLAYLYLRRYGPAGLRWPSYVVAGALPGLLALLAEAVTQLGGARLFQLVSEASVNDQAVQEYLTTTRFNQMLMVLFTGALVAIFLLGRTLTSATEATPADPQSSNSSSSEESNHSSS